MDGECVDSVVLDLFSVRIAQGCHIDTDQITHIVIWHRLSLESDSANVQIISLKCRPLPRRVIVLVSGESIQQGLKSGDVQLVRRNVRRAVVLAVDVANVRGQICFPSAIIVSNVPCLHLLSNLPIHSLHLAVAYRCVGARSNTANVVHIRPRGDLALEFASLVGL